MSLFTIARELSVFLLSNGSVASSSSSIDHLERSPDHELDAAYVLVASDLTSALTPTSHGSSLKKSPTLRRTVSFAENDKVYFDRRAAPIKSILGSRPDWRHYKVVAPRAPYRRPSSSTQSDTLHTL